MDIREIQETPIWGLYEKGRNYHRLTGIYADTDRNYRFYNGNQWEGAKLGDVEPVQKNFIKPVVKYKVSVIDDNLYGIVYSSQNFENMEFHKQAGNYCDMLNRYASRIWEQDKMDFKGRRITKDAAINDEGIIYVNFDQEKMVPINEIVKKNDIYYGNENDDDIQAQPYILIRKRMPVANAVEFALANGMSESKLAFIIGDNDTFEESGEAAKQELDNMVTVVYKMYKKDGTVHFSIATRWVEIADDVDTGLSLYPIAHMNWEEKEGSARGEGEVRYLIPNQIEVNRTEVRRVLTVKYQAYPQKVADVSKIANPGALNTVGGVIKTNGSPVDDVHRIVGTIPPAQMSPDVKQLQEDLIQVTRELAGAGDTATGQVNPESASGRAILAVQAASQQPMTEQKEAYKNFVEDLARIWLEYLIVYSENGINLEEVSTDPATGEEIVQIVNVPQATLERLQATVKIDITPKSVYDRFAQEQTIENLFLNGLLSAQRVSELEVYYKILPDDSVAPKVAIGEAIEYIKGEQQKIAQMQAQAQIMQQRAAQFLSEDPDGQASQMADAMAQLEAEYAMQEQELDAETAEAEEQVAEE
jgi:DNA uptake protein ComE-like DNA-binding protein